MTVTRESDDALVGLALVGAVLSVPALIIVFVRIVIACGPIFLALIACDFTLGSASSGWRWPRLGR